MAVKMVISWNSKTTSAERFSPTLGVGSADSEEDDEDEDEAEFDELKRKNTLAIEIVLFLDL